MIYRPRRLRKSQPMRNLARENRCSEKQLILPVFVVDGKKRIQPIESMPGQNRYSVDMLKEILAPASKMGIGGVLFFGVPDEKDDIGSGGWDDNGAVQRAVRFAKENYPDLLVITDVCMCEYTSHGHCGILKDGDVDNDATLELLQKEAISHAKAGADIVAPSDMMDGRVAAIREALDESGFDNVSIMSYSVKYASAFYGPFREAAGSSPSFGDRKTYQMDYHNSREAIKEVMLDVEEGADMVIVKPALSYLDIIKEVKNHTDIPVAAYNVSGEYSMVKAGAKMGWIDEKKIVCEIAMSMIRAGADILITYFALELAQYIKDGEIG